MNWASVAKFMESINCINSLLTQTENFLLLQPHFKVIKSNWQNTS